MAKRIYEESESIYDDGEEDFSGFEVSDERSIFFKHKEVEEEAPICSPIPQNELTAIVTNPRGDFEEGDFVQLFFSEQKNDEMGGIITPYCGGIIFSGDMAGEFKVPLIEKIYKDRRGLYAVAKVTSAQTPVMVTIFFSKEKKEGAVKI